MSLEEMAEKIMRLMDKAAPAVSHNLHMSFPEGMVMVRLAVEKTMLPTEKCRKRFGLMLNRLGELGVTE